MIKNKETVKKTEKKPLEIYVHIPFCIRKCAYCDFLSAPAAREVQKAYVEQLLREIKTSEKLSEVYEVVTVFFGGGTPSILKGEQLCCILEALQNHFPFREDAEITVEANPGTVDQDKLLKYQEAGVNRISFGLQSADNEELKLLGRIHTWEQFLESFQTAREAGFQNINVDLMSALPGQTLNSVCRTLDLVLALSPEHISAYSLMLEEGTPFYERYKEHPEYLPSEEEERQMYYRIRDRLCTCGYNHYEISNYAKPGYVCRHNLGYWERRDYKGYGTGAASLLGNVRYTNQAELSEYLKGDFAGTKEVLTEQAVREEYFFLGLRKMEGVEPGKYGEYYREQIQKLQMQKLLEEEDGRIRLTRRGIDLSNYVMAQFLM